jgi:hypothetical protein
MLVTSRLTYIMSQATTSGIKILEDRRGEHPADSAARMKSSAGTSSRKVENLKDLRVPDKKNLTAKDAEFAEVFEERGYESSRIPSRALRSPRFILLGAVR